MVLGFLTGMFRGWQMAQATSPSDLYSEAPCELHSLSALKDIQGNVWGVGDGNLWWFNATNLSWSLLPMPNATASSEPWRVVCVDPKKYVVLLGRNSSIILHLPWQHWQFGDTEDVDGGHVDKDATWCVSGFLFAVDSHRDALYVLDAEEARWTVRDDLPVVPNVNWSIPHGVVNSWVGYNNELIMVEIFGEHNRVIYTNASAINWVVMTEKEPNCTWPDLNQSMEGLSLAFKLESELLWLWKEDKGITELWSFGYSSGEWKKGSREFASKLPPLISVLTSWEQDGKFCILKKDPGCAFKYSVSTIDCWAESEMIASSEDSTKSETATGSTTESFTTAQPNPTVNVIPKPEKSTKNFNYSSTTRMTSVPTTTSIPYPPTKSSSQSHKPVKKPGVTKHQSKPDMSWKAAQSDLAQIDIVPSTDSNWHQHTSVFGSVIFFGTSITIFALFGLFWCGRKCVHFPKEALLLRDPPSVRYTAIPDSLTYDSRRPTPATYTVIPDSIA
ncbi:hypothetical protein JTE90_013322 [Oedothorax gibbosus]|uniref:Uncharacterized protein n=1 Tax=Oedothorax gibbosus TaxID=931172 RepID=A0AAV6VD49_9ARAC|nr:hypothetical protein JTE90_013322 [Oedothorax gibbosus]